MYDPEYDYLPAGLATYRLEGETFAEVEVKASAVYSPALGLEIVDTGRTLRLREPESGRFLAPRKELEDKAARLAAKLRELGLDPEQI